MNESRPRQTFLDRNASTLMLAWLLFLSGGRGLAAEKKNARQVSKPDEKKNAADAPVVRLLSSTPPGESVLATDRSYARRGIFSISRSATHPSVPRVGEPATPNGIHSFAIPTARVARNVNDVPLHRDRALDDQQAVSGGLRLGNPSPASKGFVAPTFGNSRGPTSAAIRIGFLAEGFSRPRSLRAKVAFPEPQSVTRPGFSRQRAGTRRRLGNVALADSMPHVPRRAYVLVVNVTIKKSCVSSASEELKQWQRAASSFPIAVDRMKTEVTDWKFTSKPS